MTNITIEVLKAQLPDLLRRVEQGETIVVTRDGTPIFDLVPRPQARVLNLEAGYAYLRSQGLGDPFPYVAEDFALLCPKISC